MTDRVLLAMPADVHRAIWGHLFSDRRGREEAAFLFARQETSNGEAVFRHVEWVAVPTEGFEFRSSAHFELTDAMRATVIKRAHDLGLSLVELHSHIGHWPAAFSLSDTEGFREFVPHVWWRLKSRPYLAVVVAPTGFDGFAWITGPGKPQALDGILVGAELLPATGLSRWDGYHDD